MPNWSSENQKGFFSSFLKKKIKISQNKEKTQNASIKTPNPLYPTHDAQPMTSLNTSPGKGLMLPNLNVYQVSLSTGFLNLSLPNNEFSNVSPFVIQKAVIGIGGEPQSVKRLRSGDLLVETNSALQTKSFSLAKSFLNSPVTISPHKTLNSCRGTISETDLLSTPDGEILECFSNLGVTQLDALTVEYAHTYRILCAVLSGREARKLIVPQLSQTYAQAAKSSILNNSTQTDENITKIKCPPLKLLAPLSSKQRPNISTANTTSYSAQMQLLPSISSKTFTISNPQPPTPMSETKEKTKEQPPPIAREQDSPNESSPVSKRCRKRKTSKILDAMNTNADPSDTDYVTGLTSEEDQSLLEANFKQVADNPLKGPLSPSSPQKLTSLVSWNYRGYI
ncbi:uncharacterized protein TNCV_2709981 [Trichonephila clavipes]|nr:uncharacterized protein TNCV_2709981 [Trichonephila clavipes]